MLHDEVHHEQVVVLDADTIVDPRAVMIVPVNASLADDTVTTTAAADDLTLGAQALRLERL